VALQSQRGRAMLPVWLVSFNSTIPRVCFSLLFIAASDLQNAHSACSVVFGVTLTLLVINTSSSVSREQQTTPLTSNECHQLVTVQRSCVYNTWRSGCWQHAIKQDITGRESRFLPSLPSFDALVRGSPSEYCHNVWCEATRVVWLPDG